MAYSLSLGVLSFLLAVIWGRPLITLLKRLKIGKQIRVEGPTTHQVKTGTPTMGGLMIVIPVLVITGVLNVGNLWGITLLGRSILVPMAVLVAFGTLGAIDDLMGVRVIPTGMLGRYKLLWQLIFSAITAMFLHFALDLRSIAIPSVVEKIDIGLFYIPIAMFIIVGTSNAVNLTDGLDGLAGSIAAVSFTAYGVVAFLQEQLWLVAFVFTVVGAILAFLWYNAHPAELFMGDTGSLSIGATLAVVALMTGQWLLLPLLGFVFVAEAVSVILQVTYFKATGGKRLFRMSPLHHHFELMGWSETHVTQRFWLIGILSAMLGIALALI
ncbi:phospho-N-acetylmuramoyl-pentapeptide-transferase [Anaerolineales bacterium HSG6]|nr:phospho-N-acetylmuramoyl-pentapeptide-transferase [Anaerolineales bacterium HSG6]MDM8529646.1 phospho-N-acetylmuramoyl-pentapeptide-transferase [Anaerolineales bacterium HSG25]